jgi:pimeloyl-ACP methyl ester carboxylesterase
VTQLTTRLIADAGHFIPDEQPADLWQAVDEFIALRPANQ